MLFRSTGDAQAAAAELAAVHTYLSPEQILASPKILIGTVSEIAGRVIDRGARLGLTYQVLRGAAPEVLGQVISEVRQAVQPGGGGSSPRRDSAAAPSSA